MPYIVVSNTFVKEVCILREDAEFCVVGLISEDRRADVSVFRVRRSRIYGSKADAEAHTGNRIVKKKREDTAPTSKRPQLTHHDYELMYYQELCRRGGRR